MTALCHNHEDPELWFHGSKHATAKAKAPTGPVIQLIIGADWPGVRALPKIPDALTDKVVDSKTNPCT